jgi:hypothetical protein
MPTHHAAWMINHPGGRSGRRVDYGRTYVVRPKGRHLATIVWLHGLGDNGARYRLIARLIPTAVFLKLCLFRWWSFMHAFSRNWHMNARNYTCQSSKEERTRLLQRRCENIILLHPFARNVSSVLFVCTCMHIFSKYITFSHLLHTQPPSVLRRTLIMLSLSIENE